VRLATYTTATPSIGFEKAGAARYVNRRNRFRRDALFDNELFGDWPYNAVPDRQVIASRFDDHAHKLTKQPHHRALRRMLEDHAFSVFVHRRTTANATKPAATAASTHQLGAPICGPGAGVESDSR
jgi:hypothetical protein